MIGVHLYAVADPQILDKIIIWYLLNKWGIRNAELAREALSAP